MKLFINAVLPDHTGDLIKDGDAADAPAAKLGSICVKAVVTDVQADAAADGGAKMRRWNLARHIQKEMKEHTDEKYGMEISVEDVDLIKKRVGKLFQTAIVGPVWNAIENP